MLNTHIFTLSCFFFLKFRHSRLIYYKLSFSSPAFPKRLWGKAAPDYAATPLDPPTKSVFCWDEVPNGSNKDL